MLYEFAVLSIFPLAVICAAIMDMFTMTIPNKISIALVIGFFVLAPFAGLGVEGILLHVATGLAMLAITVGFFAMGWIGGGDAKLFSAVALWIGFEHLLHYAVFAAFAGGILTLALLFARKIPLPVFLVRFDWVTRLHNPKEGVPYGIALGAAALLVYPSTIWMTVS